MLQPYTWINKSFYDMNKVEKDEYINMLDRYGISDYRHELTMTMIKVNAVETEPISKAELASDLYSYARELKRYNPVWLWQITEKINPALKNTLGSGYVEVWYE